jgi:hypothetical protein
VALSRLVGFNNTATSYTSVVVEPPPNHEKRSDTSVALFLAFALHLGEGECLRSARATSPSSMASSPLSTPGTPRMASPLPSEDDLGRSLPPSLDDAHTMATQNEADFAWQTGVPASAGRGPLPDAAVNTALKGKEKAAKGPLRLLDLPVDVLKEIIHQVLVGPHGSHGCYALSVTG